MWGGGPCGRPPRGYTPGSCILDSRAGGHKGPLPTSTSSPPPTGVVVDSRAGGHKGPLPTSTSSPAPTGVVVVVAGIMMVVVAGVVVPGAVLSSSQDLWRSTGI